MQKRSKCSQTQTTPDTCLCIRLLFGAISLLPAKMWSVYFELIRVGSIKPDVSDLLQKCSKGKGKGLPITGHERPRGEQMYSSTLPSTSTLDGVGGQTHAPAALPPVKVPYPLYRRLGGPPQGRSGRMRKISPPLPTGIRSTDAPVCI